MARSGKRASKMPAMTAKLPERLIYDYSPVARLRSVVPRLLRRTRPDETGATAKPIAPMAPGYDCWIGECNRGCGRTLISATTNPREPAGKYRCGLCG
jgi:hypothetical protein